MNHYAKIKLTPMQVQWDSIFKKQAVLIAVFMVNIATVLDWILMIGHEINGTKLRKYQQESRHPREGGDPFQQ